MANEQTSVPLYAASEILTAANMNISAGTGVPVFATTVTRDAAFGGANEKVLAEGQLCYLSATNVVQYYDGAAWATVGPVVSGKVLQVVTTFKSDTFTSTAFQTFTDITGFSASITPSLASSKVLILTSLVMGGRQAVNGAAARLMRDSTAIAIGDTAGSRARVTFSTYLSADDDFNGQNGHMYLDSPATTSATTYKWQVYNSSSTIGSVFVNRGELDGNDAGNFRSASSIILMEIGA